MIDPNNPICRGFLRPDGRKGIRDKLLLIYTVDCSAHVAFKIAEALTGQGHDVEVIGQRSCHDHQNRVFALLAYCVHPNVGAVLAVGHGCESTSAEAIHAFAAENGRPSEWFTVHQAGGTRRGISQGVELARSLLERMRARRQPVDFYWRDLCVSAKCGGSDYTSGLTGNPLVGAVFDFIVDAGGTCLFAEMNEGLGLRDYFAGRAACAAAREELLAAYDKAERACRLGGRFFITPGNIRGGLTTIEEKSLGSAAKSGNRPVQGVLQIGQRPPWQGLWMFDETSDEVFEHSLDHEGNQGGDCAVLMLMNAAGCHMNYLVTGRGHVCGVGISPTLKITGNPDTYDKLRDDIDFSAGPLLTGELSIEAMRDRLLEHTARICRGQPTLADAQGHRENEMWSVAQAAGCTPGP
ncbi:D-galactarate dehydratase/altronate hydrolase domain protein [uncultured delta proteobacterium]|uniref:D-galactarate dehydratase/altronate hydrolase domain protein n=1 Tax=uncultured delta proteobacterium TaxID=34034 RepID=A0A212K863_9DELT|nr:D-galactarate dehydratase/altronate hydrolase domain protein [uncultured delta proteobacterium]